MLTFLCKSNRMNRYNRGLNSDIISKGIKNFWVPTLPFWVPTISQFWSQNCRFGSQLAGQKIFLNVINSVFGVLGGSTPHIIENLKCVYNFFEDQSPFTNRIHRTIQGFKRKILNLEIKYTFWVLKNTKEELNDLRQKIIRNTDPDVYELFLTGQDEYYEKATHKCDKTRKTDWSIHPKPQIIINSREIPKM